MSSPANPTSPEPMRYDPVPYDQMPYDAVLVVSFGGPEGPDEVLPFLENVLRGKNVPRERMLEVVEHYQQFGGVSPINQQCRDFIAALEARLADDGPHLPIYWGNRNWRPMLADTLCQMADDGIKRAIAVFTNAFSCYSGCRQYRENIAAAQAEVGERAPRIEKLRMPYNHPGFIEANADHLQKKLAQVPIDRRDKALVLFTAHSIPMSMAENCRYEQQLQDACHLVASGVGHERWELVYQSRSGPPQQPWLEPDVCDHITARHAEGELQDLIILPIGFVSDHMEVLFDLDTEANDLCEKLGVGFGRAATVGVHPQWIKTFHQLIDERIAAEKGESPERPALGQYGPSHDLCPENCCLYTPKRPPGVGKPAGAGRPATESA